MISQKGNVSTDIESAATQMPMRLICIEDARAARATSGLSRADLKFEIDTPNIAKNSKSAGIPASEPI